MKSSITMIIDCMRQENCHVTGDYPVTPPRKNLLNEVRTEEDNRKWRISCDILELGIIVGRGYRWQIGGGIRWNIHMSLR